MATDIIKQIGMVTLLAVVLIIGYNSGLNQVMREDVKQVDTLYVCDTITHYEPILEERVVLQEVLVQVRDTIWIHDTLYVSLDYEQVVWQDSLSRVYVSGVLPQIDSVQHFISERVVTRELTQVVKKPCRWGVGFHVGYGIQLGEQVKTAPYIGFGFNYNILTW